MTVLLVAAPASAGFEVRVTKADGFDLAAVSRVAVVTVECAPVVNCQRLEERVQLQAAGVPADFTVVPPVTVRKFLFDKGHTSYSTELRTLLAEQFEVDALIELKVPYAQTGDGFGGVRSSDVTVELVMIRPTGELLLHAVGTGRPLNVVTSPERVAGNVVEKILERVFR